MTFREKLIKEYPHKATLDFWDSMMGCPSHYGYETPEDSVKNCRQNRGNSCEFCWNREIPEVHSCTDEKSTSKDKFAGMDDIALGIIGAVHIVQIERDIFEAIKAVDTDRQKSIELLESAIENLKTVIEIEDKMHEK